MPFSPNNAVVRVNSAAANVVQGPTASNKIAVIQKASIANNTDDDIQVDVFLGANGTRNATTRIIHDMLVPGHDNNGSGNVDVDIRGHVLKNNQYLSVSWSSGQDYTIAVSYSEQD